jgi:hypothetical protein
MVQNQRYERGIALVMALVALLIVTSIALSMMFATDTETSINSNFRDEQTAFYASKSGLEEVRDRMRTGATNSINANLPAALPGAANGVLYILNPTGSEAVAPWNTTNAYFDDEICKEVDCSGGQVPPTSGWYVSPALTASTTYAASPVLLYKWMRITLKTDQSAAGTANIMYVDGKSADASYYACWNGTNEIASSTACASPNVPVYMLTALGVTPSGTRRILQYEVTQASFNLLLPSALTLAGPLTSADYSSPGGGFIVNGNNPSATSNAGAVPNCANPAGYAMEGQGATSTTNLTAVATPATDFPGTGGTGAAPSVTDGTAALHDAGLDTVAGLNSLVATLTANADEVDTDCSSSNLGSLANPRIVVITGGSCNISGNPATPGNGILLVTGPGPVTQLNFADNPYNGIILVIGPGAYFDQQSAKNSHLAGEILVANTAGTPPGTIGAPLFSWHSGAGKLATPSIQYDSCLVAQDSQLKNFKLISSRELMY